MSFLFGKKQSVQALAEVLEDGREIMNTEMKKPKNERKTRDKRLNIDALR